MRLIDEIRKLMYKREYYTGTPLKKIPLTYDEITWLQRESPLLVNVPMTDSPMSLMNVEVQPHDFAAQIRNRQIELPRAVYVSEIVVDESQYKSVEDRVYAHRQVRLSLERYICHDDAELEMTFVWDPWEWWKKKLHLTRWFPVKERTVHFDTRILYPHLNVRLPYNEHHVKVKIAI